MKDLIIILFAITVVILFYAIIGFALTWLFVTSVEVFTEYDLSEYFNLIWIIFVFLVGFVKP